MEMFGSSSFGLRMACSKLKPYSLSFYCPRALFQFAYNRNRKMGEISWRVKTVIYFIRLIELTIEGCSLRYLWLDALNF